MVSDHPPEALPFPHPHTPGRDGRPAAARPVRVLFMGTPAFAVPSLEALVASPELVTVVGVVTQPDRPAGRGRALMASAVKQAAVRHGIPVLQPRRMRHPDTWGEFAALGAQLYVVAAYGRILPPAVLEQPQLGCINVHASLLPRHRGASPINHAILAGDAEAGVCIMGMEEGLDTGPVLDRAGVAIGPAEGAGALTERLAQLGAERLRAVLPALVAGTGMAVPQPTIGVTHAPPLQKGDGLLDFAHPADQLARRVRAMDPWPGAHAFAAGERFGVLAATALMDGGGGSDAAPGTVLAADAQGIVVACGHGALRLTRVRPAGRKDMDAGAWATGRGPKVGAQLTAQAAVPAHTGEEPR